MAHKAIEQVFERAERAKADSDFTYYFELLGTAEALAKTIVAGMVASVRNGKEGNRYRLEHQLVRASGLGDWAQALDDAVKGHAAQYLLIEARTEQSEINLSFKSDAWQYQAVDALAKALGEFDIKTDALNVKCEFRRWFWMLATLRNKTKGHGAAQTHRCGRAAAHLYESLRLVYENFALFQRPWVYLYRHMSGKAQLSPIGIDSRGFEQVDLTGAVPFQDGIYVYMGEPRRVNLMYAEPSISDFHYANGGLTAKGYELLSYYTDKKLLGDAADYSKPPGTLPKSETEGHGELQAQGNCFTNIPQGVRDYIPRPSLEEQLRELLLDDKRPIVTLLGRGGIGKTSLALKVIHDLLNESRYEAIVWISARDIDLKPTGPKPVGPAAVTPTDMSKLYAALVLPPAKREEKDFKAMPYFEGQLQKCDLGPCLFVLDNFETTQNPIEVYKWIDTFIRLPNKVLITTRLRDFKGDYPVEIRGMTDGESRRLIDQTAKAVDVTKYLTEEYIKDLIKQSEGHPYVIKVLLGEVAKLRRAAKIDKVVAGTDDILMALFDRTYASLAPCAQRAFLTLSAWNSPVPRLVLEAVLIQSTGERSEVENGVESLIQYSMAEIIDAETDKQEFISLPLVASVFGKKKLTISPAKPVIAADVEMLQMLGATQKGDTRLGLAVRLERFLSEVSRRQAKGEKVEKYTPILEAVCRAYNPGWLILARWHMNQRTGAGFTRAKEELRRFLENAPPWEEATVAWRLLADCCYATNDPLGEVHAFIERAQIATVPFIDVSDTAARFSQFLTQGLVLTPDQRRDFAERLLNVMDARIHQATPVDLSRMAWLAIHLKDFTRAKGYVRSGLSFDTSNYHLERLAERLGVVFRREDRVKVYLTKDEAAAKHRVFIVDNDAKQMNQHIIAHGRLVEHEYQAKVSVYITENEATADILIVRKNFPKK